MDYHSDDSSDPDTPEGFKSACGKRADSLRAVDVMAILHEKVAFLSGGRDPRGGPLLTFPACDKREKLKHTDYRPLLHYLTRIPSDDVCDLGFTVIVDMRGSTWGTVKPVLKELHLTFAHTVHIVYIIKPDNFWQKQRTSIGSQKYKFETSLMSVGALCKSVDPGQLTADFDGTLPYDHNTWIELRLAIEEFTACTNNTLDQLESVRHEVINTEMAEDVSMAKTAVEKHKQLQQRLTSPAIRDLHTMGHRLLQSSSKNCAEGWVLLQAVVVFVLGTFVLSRPLCSRGVCARIAVLDIVSSVSGRVLDIQTGVLVNDLLPGLQCDESVGSSGGYDSGYSGRDSASSLILANPDLQACVPGIMRSLSSVEGCVSRVQQSWMTKKHRLEQCLQLRMLEQDVEKMFDWLYHNREEFLVSYVEIGHTCHMAKHLQESHSQFTVACQKVYLNLNKILSVASHLIESGHYASQHIASLASKLDQVWKEFAAGLDERSSVLALSVMFHQKAEQYIESVNGWIESCSASGLSNDIRSLETNIHLHQQLYETMCQAYTEVHSTSKKLLYQLDHLVQICSQLRRDTPHRSKHVTPDGKVVYRGGQQQQQQQQAGSGSASVSSSASTSASSTPQPGVCLCLGCHLCGVLCQLSVGLHSISATSTPQSGVCLCLGCHLCGVLYQLSVGLHSISATSTPQSGVCLCPGCHLCGILCQLSVRLHSISDTSTPQSGKSKAGVVTGSPASDYSEGASHVLAVIHEILAHHRAVEQRWTDKKHKLHQRLALRLFQEDVKQVMDWLGTHGEVFLCKNPGVGRSLAKACMYQKSHEHFEMVAQNTYTNAEKLLQAAEELAHTGECNPQEIYNVAQQLDSHISSFVARVHQRRRLLQLAVMFYTHEGELVAWLREVVADAASDDVRGLTTIEAAEEALSALQQQQDATEDACANTALEGQSLLQQLGSMGVTAESGCGSVAGVEEALDRLAKEQAAIQNVWTARRIKLDLLLQLRLFQRDAVQVLESVEEWAREAAAGSGSSSSGGSGTAVSVSGAGVDVLEGLDQRDAEQLLLLHNENMAAMQQEALQALRRGHEIIQLLKTSGLELECEESSGEEDPCDDTTVSAGGGPTSTAITASIASGGSDTPTNSGGEDSSGSGGGGMDTSSRHSYCSGGDGASSGGSSVGGGAGGTGTVTATTVSSGGGRRSGRDGLPSSSGGSEKVSTLVELLHSAQLRLESIAQEKQNKLEQVIQLGHFMDQAQQVQRWIHSGDAMLLASFSIPDSLAEAHAMSQDHQQFQVAIEKTHTSVVQLRERAAQLHHCNSQQLVEVKTSVAKSWENLVTCAEDRHKLVQASIAFYKTAEQVCSVLESLERDYRRDDDWCQKDINVDGGICDKASALHLRIEKHQEQKESFLRACTLARKTAQTFLKYANRSLMFYRVEEEVYGPENKVRAILDDLMVKENNVLECWTEKKRTLDQCAQYVELENNAKMALDWITQTGEKYLESHTSLGDTKEETEQLLKEHNMFKVTAKDTRENVKMILQLADKLVENGHKHANSIREWVARVDLAYKNFSARMDKYRMQLEERLGICSEESKASLSLDRHSDPSLEHKMQAAAVAGAKMEMSEEKRRSARKKELIMKELLDTERTYVKDLEICISCYMHETRQPTAPKALQGKEHIIFCNMEEILGFHKNTFLQELEKYKAMPEDAGHCFVTYAHKFDIYVKYCKAQPESNKLLVSDAGNFYEDVQRKHNVEHPIPAYLIKPVQRITKYQLLLRELLACCEEDNPGEIREGLEVMQNVPKKANDVLHLSMLEGCDIPIDKLGDVILQDSFQVWDPRQLLRKHRERHVFLFEHHVVFCKEVKEQTNTGSGSSGASQLCISTKYQYKQRLVTSELGLSEHSEGDECKFALWGGARTGAHDSKMILRANTVETKQAWVRKLRQVIQDSYLSNHLAKTATNPAVSVSSSSIKSSTSSLASQTSKSTASVKSAAVSGVTASPGGGRKSMASTTAVVMAATATAAGGKLEAARRTPLRSAPPTTANTNNNNSSSSSSTTSSRIAGDIEPLVMAADRISLTSFASDTSSERAADSFAALQMFLAAPEMSVVEVKLGDTVLSGELFVFWLVRAGCAVRSVSLLECRVESVM
ncbi:Dbl (DH) domain [Trinorchestia longiramus]|nr:Dbl (DH) domain [Trinorchestia longiramus]